MVERIDNWKDLEALQDLIGTGLGLPSQGGSVLISALKFPFLNGSQRRGILLQMCFMHERALYQRAHNFLYVNLNFPMSGSQLYVFTYRILYAHPVKQALFMDAWLTSTHAHLVQSS